MTSIIYEQPRVTVISFKSQEVVETRFEFVERRVGQDLNIVKVGCQCGFQLLELLTDIVQPGPLRVIVSPSSNKECVPMP